MGSQYITEEHNPEKACQLSLLLEHEIQEVQAIHLNLFLILS